MKRFFLLFLTLFSLSFSAFSSSIRYENLPVIRIVDGDTLHVLLDEKKQSVRLLGIQAPELYNKGKPPMAYAQESTDALRSFLGKKNVDLVVFPYKKKDTYQRFLALVYPHGSETSAQEFLVRYGHVHLYIFPDSPLPLDFIRSLQALEFSAQSQSLGLWALPAYTFISPSDAENHLRTYAFVEGVVYATYSSTKAYWITFSPDKVSLSVRIDKKNAPRFPDLDSLVGKTIRVRGFINPWAKGPVMDLWTPFSLDALP